jgi:molybdopterin-guanine dinucleotide biosynthesis protein A
LRKLKAPRPFAALLLAGGRSSRMGSPKALLDWCGRPLWRHQAETLDALAPDERFISLPPGLAVDCGIWTPVVDRVPDLGPLGGIEAALRAMRSDWLVVLAIDLPAMTTDYLRARLAAVGARVEGARSAESPAGDPAAAQANAGEVEKGTAWAAAPAKMGPARGAIATDDGTFLGLAGVYPRAILPLVEAALVDGDRSVQQLARRAIAAGLLAVHPLAGDERALFRNLNRAGD